MPTADGKLHGSRKRSVVIRRKRTSISLEDSFWNSLHDIAQTENLTIGEFIDTIPRDIIAPSLSSGVRIAVLEYYQHLSRMRETPSPIR